MNEFETQADRAVTLREAARILSVCARTVGREIERGQLTGFRVGRNVRIRMSELQRYIERHTTGIHA